MQISASLSASAACPAPGAPAGPWATQAPSLPQTAVAGDDLTVFEGVWTGDGPVTLSLQWFRDGAAIGGATAAVLPGAEVLEGSLIRCSVTATDASGSRMLSTSGVRVTGLWTITGGDAVLTITAVSTVDAPSAAGAENALTFTE